MSEIITVRDSDTVAAEINTIKETARQVMIASAIMIGGKLAEAKSMVPHGEWGKWLEEKVDYSQSTADNLMKLHREYGQGQASLFDNWTNSEAFAKMSYTQHLAMMALPFESRLAFAEEHHADQMSTRELDRAVRDELDKLKAQLSDTEEQMAATQTELADAVEDRDRAEQSAKDASLEAMSYLAEKKKAEDAAAKAEQEKIRAEKSEKAALSLVDKLKAQLAEAESQRKAAMEELEEAKKNPEIPAAAMEAMRLEVEAESVKKATEKLAGELAEAQKRAEAEAEARKAAEEAAEAAARKIAELQTAGKMSDPDVAAYNALAKNMMEEYNRLDGYRLKVAARDSDAGERLKKFQLTLLEQWNASLQG